jgi:hypothetical protein
MFAPHPSLSTHHTNSMFQNNINGQASNESAANGNHYMPNSQQQQVQSQLSTPQQRAMNANSINGSAAANGGSNTSQLIYPALHLQPLNDTFAPKQISLSPPGPQNKVKIGRQTNNKTIPQPSNGYFDSKVLSRAHAEVWSQDGKVSLSLACSSFHILRLARLSSFRSSSKTSSRPMVPSSTDLDYRLRVKSLIYLSCTPTI